MQTLKVSLVAYCLHFLAMGYSYLRADEISTEVYLPGIAEYIKKLDPNDSKEGMRFFTVPHGSMKNQLEELGGTVDKWVNLSVNGYSHGRLVWK